MVLRFAPIRQEICDVSQIGIPFHRICPTIFRPDPDCNSTANVPSLTLRTTLSAIPLVSELCGADVEWFQDRSSQDLPNSKELSVWVTLGILFGSKNFCKLPCVSWEVFVLHGYAWIRWVAKSCTTTAYRWSFRDSLSLLRTLWSAVIKSPKNSALGTTVPARLLQEALVILVFKHVSQFGSFGGKCGNTQCLPEPVPLLLATPLVIHKKNWQCLDIQAQGLHVALKDYVHRPLSLWNPAGSPASHAIDRCLLRVLHICFCFRFLSVYAAGFSVAPHSYFPLLSSTGFFVYLLKSNTEPCDEDDDDVGESVVEEELADKPRTTRCA